MVVFRPSAVKAHLPGMRDYVTECRDLGRRGGRGRARRERVVSPRASRSRSRGWADDDDRRHPTVRRLPTEPARRTAHTSTTTHPGAHLPPRPRRHRSRQTPPIRYSRPRRTVRYQRCPCAGAGAVRAGGPLSGIPQQEGPRGLLVSHRLQPRNRQMLRTHNDSQRPTT
jgi:hypothetical protein